mmetsp:Transcript_44845/g.97501  ORF Transcript_44845/g.97501 Transcript_44845/m.97501 type:complete len:239 (-) Transcript_44845:880-1596(-)
MPTRCCTAIHDRTPVAAASWRTSPCSRADASESTSSVCDRGTRRTASATTSASSRSHGPANLRAIPLQPTAFSTSSRSCCRLGLAHRKTIPLTRARQRTTSSSSNNGWTSFRGRHPRILGSLRMASRTRDDGAACGCAKRSARGSPAAAARTQSGLPPRPAACNRSPLRARCTSFSRSETNWRAAGHWRTARSATSSSSASRADAQRSAMPSRTTTSFTRSAASRRWAARNWRASGNV